MVFFLKYFRKNFNKFNLVHRDSYDIVHAFNITSLYAMKYAKRKKKVHSVHNSFIFYRTKSLTI